MRRARSVHLLDRCRAVAALRAAVLAAVQALRLLMRAIRWVGVACAAFAIACGGRVDVRAIAIEDVATAIDAATDDGARDSSLGFIDARPPQPPDPGDAAWGDASFDGGSCATRPNACSGDLNPSWAGPMVLVKLMADCHLYCAEATIEVGLPDGCVVRLALEDRGQGTVNAKTEACLGAAADTYAWRSCGRYVVAMRGGCGPK